MVCQSGKLARATALLVAVCCLAVAAAADLGFMLGDKMAASTSAKAKTASGYYGNTEMACMKQLNFKNCRYTGCPVENEFDSCDAGGGGTCMGCEPDSIYFQSDFSCCPTEHDYYGDKQQDIGLVAFDNKVGTCDWEISLYRTWYDEGATTESDPWMPHLTDDGTALKWGTAWGTCYLNAEAERCGSPLCERMAINIQGGLYATAAYVPEISVDVAPSLEFCNNDPPPFLDPTAIGGRSTPDSAAARTPSPPRTVLDRTLGYIQQASVCFFCRLSVFGRPSTTCSACGLSKRSASFRAPKNVGSLRKAGAKANIMGADYDHNEKYFPAVALVISGPMSVTTEDDKVRETGMYEFTLTTTPWVDAIPDVAGVEPTNRWPIVQPRTARVRFTRRQDEYYQRDQ